jgi:hypothetical protein
MQLELLYEACRVAKAPYLKAVDVFLSQCDSYERAERLAWLMVTLPWQRRLRVFLEWYCVCDAPWGFRNIYARQLRLACAEVNLSDVLLDLTDFLRPEERTFYIGLPALVPIWRGCERGRERGLSWTTERAVAEGFAKGQRCINEQPTLASAVIPKSHIFGVFCGRGEREVVVDPRRLRKLAARAVVLSEDNT